MPTIHWEKCYGGSLGDNCYSLCESHDGNYVIAGFSNSYDGDIVGPTIGGFDVWLCEIDSGNGAILWQHNIGGTDYDNCKSIIRTMDGGYILTGESKSPFIPGSHGPTNSDAYVCKVDSAGVLEWHHCYGGTGDDGGNSIIETFDSTFLIAGYASAASGDVHMNKGGYDFWIFKVNNTGTILWEKTFGGSGYDEASAIVSIDSSFIIAGTSSSHDSDVTGNHGLKDFWVIGVDSSGNLIWEKSYGGSDEDICFNIIKLNRSFYASGYTSSNNGDITNFNGGIFDGWVVKLDLNGQLKAQKTIGGSGGDVLYFGIDSINSNSILISGEAGSTDGNMTGLSLFGSGDYFIANFDSSLNMQWINNYGGNDNDRSNCLLNTSDGKILMAGITYSTTGQVSGYHNGPNGDSDIWLVKLDTNILLSAHDAVVSKFFFIVPNIFESEIDILPSDNGRIYNVELTDITGKVIAVFNKLQSRHQLQLNGIRSGMYILTITSDSNSTSFKVFKK